MSSSAYTCSSSSSFDTYGGVFKDGYCVWEIGGSAGPVLVSCHCRPGYVCGSPPGELFAADIEQKKISTVSAPYPRKRIRVRCIPPA